MRVVLVVLLLMNAVVAGYFVLNPVQAHTPKSKTEADIPALVLLSERQTEVLSSPSETASEGSIALTPDASEPAPVLQCHRLGPFEAEQRAVTARKRLTGKVSALKLLSVEESRSNGFWVYIPAAASRDEALETSRKLSAVSVRDFFVVTTGETQNAISLGMFKDALNADRRRSEVAALGFTVRRRERTEKVPRYFLEFLAPEPGSTEAVPIEADAKRAWLVARRLPANVSLEKGACQSG